MKLSSQMNRAEETKSCEFCRELLNDPSSRFRRLYYPQLESRIVARRYGFVVLPTLGQLFKGSLLVLPESHFETFSSLPQLMVDRLPDLVTELESSTQQFGLPLIFEHGARCHTGAGCGIYHAHLHLVPLPESVHHSVILPGTSRIAANISEALRSLRSSSLYLLVRDTHGNTAFLEPSPATAMSFPSQYVRRRLVDHFKLRTPWDWRDYTGAEPWLLETVQLLETHVSFSS